MAKLEQDSLRRQPAYPTEYRLQTGSIHARRPPARIATQRDVKDFTRETEAPWARHAGFAGQPACPQTATRDRNEFRDQQSSNGGPAYQLERLLAAISIETRVGRVGFAEAGRRRTIALVSSYAIQREPRSTSKPASRSG